MTFRTRFTPHQPGKYAFTPVGESKTQQQFKEEVEINNILRKYQKTGMIDHINKHQGQYGNFADVQDYQSNLDRLMQAQSAFNDLPSSIRSRFQNDPANLITFLSDTKNRDEAIELGLIITPPSTPSLKDQMVEALAENDLKRSKNKT